MTEEYFERLCEINVLLWDVLADIFSENYIISFADVLKNIKGGKKS